MKARPSVVVAVLLSVLAGTAVAWAGVEAQSSARFGPGPAGVLFALVVGTDGRPGLEGERGDALHVIGINPALGAGTILNIPRDTWVDIPGHGQGRVNDGYYVGGAGLQALTVERLTGVRPSFVVTTSFAGFQRMVDDLGGVDIDVPMAMKDHYSGAVFAAGPTRMDGRGALAFARNRHIPDGDLRRTTHQAHLILSGLTTLRSRDPGPTSVLRSTAVLLRNARVDGLGVADLYRLARMSLTLDPSRIRNVTMPVRLGRVGARSVVFVAPAASSLFADFADDAVLQSH